MVVDRLTSLARCNIQKHVCSARPRERNPYLPCRPKARIRLHVGVVVRFLNFTFGFRGRVCFAWAEGIPATIS